MAVYIEKLPDELFLEIFSFLSSADLKNVMLVSPYFSDLIGKSSRLMRKFFIAITTKKRWDFSTISTLQRKHQNLIFFDFDNFSEPKLLHGLQNIGANLRCIEFNYCNLYIDEFLKILEVNQHHLTSLSLIHTKILEKPQKFFDFECLESFKVVESEIELVFLEKAKKLREVHVEVNECCTVDLKEFQKILFRQKKLKSLVMINLRLSNIFDGLIKAEFQLENFSVVNCHFNHKENFEKFLENQLKIFDLEFSINNLKLQLDRVRYYEGILENILKNKFLKCLNLNVENYNFANLNFLPLNCIENLSINLKSTNFSLITFLKTFQNLKSLELDLKELTNEEIIFLNEHKNLTHMKISNLSSEIFSKLKFKSIKSLHIETCIEPCHWHVFADNNLELTKLVINFSFLMDFDVNLLEALIKKLPKIEHLELINKYVGFDNKIYKMICENCKNLKYLKLWNINIEKNFNEEDKNYLRERNVKFILFNDETLNAPMISF